VNRRPPLAALVLAAGAILTGLPARAALTPALERLLAASDPFAAAPAELRLALVFEGANGARVPLEIWRKGDDRALVRFLAPRVRGKFVLRRGGEAWLLAPGAKRPVRLSPALAPAGGAALDELLGLRLARDYRATDAREENGVVRFDLEATHAGVEPPRVRWVVDRERRLPLRAEFCDADGRVRRLVEFKSWRDPKRLVPEQIVAKDVLRGGAPLVVHLGPLEARDVPDALFDLEDGTARGALPSPAPGELPSLDAE
jgi:Outer membrane lipoprotein-sorting protein